MPFCAGPRHIGQSSAARTALAAKVRAAVSTGRRLVMWRWSPVYRNLRAVERGSLPQPMRTRRRCSTSLTSSCGPSSTGEAQVALGATSRRPTSAKAAGSALKHHQLATVGQRPDPATRGGERRVLGLPRRARPAGLAGRRVEREELALVAVRQAVDGVADDHRRAHVARRIPCAPRPSPASTRPRRRGSAAPRRSAWSSPETGSRGRRRQRA